MIHERMLHARASDARLSFSFFPGGRGGGERDRPAVSVDYRRRDADDSRHTCAMQQTYYTRDGGYRQSCNVTPFPFPPHPSGECVRPDAAHGDSPRARRRSKNERNGTGLPVTLTLAESP